jgi:4'-phosphopantetheinyl transferase
MRLARSDLWIAGVDVLLRPCTAASCERLLDSGERARNARFAHDQDRRLDLLTRALLRSVLSVYAPVPPERWRFGRDARGRPTIAGPGTRELHFSIAHAGSLVACLVSRHSGIGVDLERLDPSATVPDALAPHERARLAGQPASAFFSYWTLREAHGKARGCGLADASSDTWFELEGDHAACMRSSDGTEPGWWFQRLSPEPGYTLAVAVRVSDGSAPQLVRQGSPPLPGA